MLTDSFCPFLAPPKISSVIDEAERYLGENVNVTCRATGNPTPSIKWIKKDEGGHHISVKQSNGNSHTLQINYVQEEDFKEYVCVAENGFGNDTVSFFLSEFFSTYLLRLKTSFALGLHKSSDESTFLAKGNTERARQHSVSFRMTCQSTSSFLF